MKRLAEEAEVVARLDFEDGSTHVTVVSWPAMARKVEKRYGPPRDRGEQVWRWVVPGIMVGFRRLAKRARKPAAAAQDSVSCPGSTAKQGVSQPEIPARQLEAS